MDHHPPICRSVFLGTLCATALVIAAGCSIFTSYPETMRYAQNAFADGDFAEAVHTIGKLEPAPRDRLCHQFELGTVYHAMGDYAESNRAFLEGVEIAKEFDERALISLRDSAAFAASLLVNDKVRPYRGEPFERVLMHTYLALNFLMQKDLEGARVEVLQAYARQKALRESHAKEIDRTRAEARKKKLDTEKVEGKLVSLYSDQSSLLEAAGSVRQNLFTYYLSSLIYEMNGETSEAYIDAKTVYSLNPNFLPVRRDLLRYAKKLGLSGDYERWRGEFGKALSEATPAGHGQIVVLFECGQAPMKEEIKLGVPIPVKNHWNIVTIALPKYRSRPNPVRAAQGWCSGQACGTTAVLMDVEATAVRDLWDQALGIALRHTLRAAGRFAATEYARKNIGDLLYLPMLLFGHAVEQADLRSWLSLPRNFQVLRADVPAGTHCIRMDLLGARKADAVELKDVPVRDGGITIINLRSTRNLGTAKYAAF